MNRIKYLIILLFFSMGACLPEVTVDKRPSEDEGEVIVYLQPMPQEARKLRFIIGAIYAVRDDDLQIPLSPRIREIRGADLVSIQKYLASGPLTSGSYTGLSIEVKEAFVEGEEGESALFIPEAPVMVEGVFEVRRREALPLFLTFQPSGAIAEGVRFTPVFSLAGSSRELISLLGFVTNSDSNIISVFNKRTMQVVDVISTGRGPRGMALDRRRGRLYVAASEDDAIEVIDVLQGEMLGRITLDFGDAPTELALTSDGRILVCVNYQSNTASLIDPISLFQIRRVRVGQRPTWVVVDPFGLKAYAMNTLSKSITVVDLTQREAAPITIATEGSPVGADFRPDGNRLFVVAPDSPNLTVIDPSRAVVTNNIFIGTGAVSIRVDRRTGLILVGKKMGGEIAILEPSSFMFIDRIDVGGHAAFIDIDREEHNLFVVLPERGMVQKVNLTSKKVTSEVEVGEGAYAVVLMGEI